MDGGLVTPLPAPATEPTELSARVRQLCREVVSLCQEVAGLRRRTPNRGNRSGIGRPGTLGQCVGLNDLKPRSSSFAARTANSKINSLVARAKPPRPGTAPIVWKRTKKEKRIKPLPPCPIEASGRNAARRFRLAIPRIPLDNNASERHVRGPAQGRENDYGSGALWSGRLAAMLFSLFATLSLAKPNIRTWLTWYLVRCAENGGQAPSDIDPFLPWKMAVETRRAMALDPNGRSRARSMAITHDLRIDTKGNGPTAPFHSHNGFGKALHFVLRPFCCRSKR